MIKKIEEGGLSREEKQKLALAVKQFAQLIASPESSIDDTFLFL